MKRTRIAALLLSGVMAASALVGCGGVDTSEVVATFDETEVALGVPNFVARLQQADADDIYSYYFGDGAWETDLYGTGETLQEELKSSVMENMFQLYTLEAHMSEYGVEISDAEQTRITEAAAAFIAANSSEALEELGADQAIVEEYLRLITIESKMYDAIIATADTNVSDEEANTGAYSYVSVSKTSYTDEEGNSVEYTEEELASLAKTVGAFGTEAKVGTLEDAAETYGYSVIAGTFTANDSELDEEVLTTLQSMEEGEVSDTIDTEDAYYVVRLDAMTDAEATEETRASIISERESARYEEVLAGWQEEHTWKVDESVWEKVAFDRSFTTTEPVESTEAEVTIED